MLEFSSKTAFSGKNFTSICKLSLQSLFSCTHLRGGRLFTILALFSVFTGVFAPTKGWGQNTLKVKTYASNTISPVIKVDYSVLSSIFGTVTENGVVKTTDTNFTNDIMTLPTTSAGFGDAQCVIVQCIGSGLSLAQADALVDYVKGGGILLMSGEAIEIGHTEPLPFPTVGYIWVRDYYLLEYVGEKLFCNTVNLTSTGTQNILSSAPAFHPGEGVLSLNKLGASSAQTTTTASCITGVPSASSILLAQSSVSSPCSNSKVLDFIVPSYPKGCSTCGVNGFAILSGEGAGPMVNFNGIGNRNESQLNKNYAQLIKDFLYNPTAMATRRAWSTIASNNNATCLPVIDQCPDFTPTIEIENITFNPGTPPAHRDFVINISSNFNSPSNGPIVVKIPKTSAFTVTFPDPTATSANLYGGTSVNNSLWNYSSNSLFHTLTLMPNVALPGYGIFSIGLHVSRNTGVPPNTLQPITATIVGGSGGDSDPTNNSYNVMIKAQF